MKNCYAKLSEPLTLASVFSLFLVVPGEGLNPSMCKRSPLTGRGGACVWGHVPGGGCGYIRALLTWPIT